MRTQFLSVFATIALLTLNQAATAAPYAIAAQEINLNGYNLLCDSFDSSDPTRSTDGHYDPAKAGDGAYVASANGIFNSASVANVSIWGYFETKPEFMLAIGPVGSIGSTAWHQTGAIGIEPGHHTTNYNVMFPDVAPPFAGVVPASGVVNGVFYNYVLHSGNYELMSLSLGGNQKMIVLNTAYLYVRGNVKLSGNAYLRIEPSATFRLYVGGPSANIGGNGILNFGSAASFQYLGLHANTSLFLKFSTLAGTIYAPAATCTITSVGSSPAELEGTIAVKTLSLGAPLDVHFDEALSP